MFHFLFLDFENIGDFSCRTSVSLPEEIRDMKWHKDDLFVLKQDFQSVIFKFQPKDVSWCLDENASDQDFFSSTFKSVISPNNIVQCRLYRNSFCQFLPFATQDEEEQAELFTDCILRGENWLDIAMLPIKDFTVALLCEKQAKLPPNYRMQYFQAFESCKEFLYSKRLDSSFSFFAASSRAKCMMYYVKNVIESSFTGLLCSLSFFCPSSVLKTLFIRSQTAFQSVRSSERK